MFNLYILYLYLYNLTSELMWYNFTAMCQIEDVCSHCYFTSSCLNMILISFILLNTLYPSLPYVVNSSLPLMRPVSPKATPLHARFKILLIFPLKKDHLSFYATFMLQCRLLYQRETTLFILCF